MASDLDASVLAGFNRDEEVPAPENSHEANNLLRGLRSLELDRAEVEALYRAEREQLDDFYEDRIDGIEQMVAHLAGPLESWARAMQETHGKTIKLPAGETRLRGAPARLDVTEVFVEWERTQLLQQVAAVILEAMYPPGFTVPSDVDHPNVVAMADKLVSMVENRSYMKVTVEPSTSAIKDAALRGKEKEDEATETHRFFEACIDGEILPGVRFVEEKQPRFKAVIHKSSTPEKGTDNGSND